MSVVVRKSVTVASDETLVVEIAIPEVVSDDREESSVSCRTSCSAFSTCVMRVSASLADETSVSLTYWVSNDSNEICC